MSEFVFMRPPWGEGEIQKVEAMPEKIGPLMVAGWSQCEQPASTPVMTQEVTPHVDD